MAEILMAVLLKCHWLSDKTRGIRAVEVVVVGVAAEWAIEEAVAVAAIALTAVILISAEGEEVVAVAVDPVWVADEVEEAMAPAEQHEMEIGDVAIVAILISLGEMNAIDVKHLKRMMVQIAEEVAVMETQVVEEVTVIAAVLIGMVVVVAAVVMVEVEAAAAEIDSAVEMVAVIVTWEDLEEEAAAAVEEAVDVTTAPIAIVAR